METIRKWIHSNLIDVKSDPAKLYKDYSNWCKGFKVRPDSFSLFKTTLKWKRSKKLNDIRSKKYNNIRFIKIDDTIGPVETLKQGMEYIFDNYH
jgi:hypothetical protein